MDFITPPECQGQIVTYSYATTVIKRKAYVIKERYDASDRTTTYSISRMLVGDQGDYWNGRPSNRRWRKISQAEFDSIQD